MPRLGRIASMAMVAFLLGGCALPVPIKIAGWALDGISYLATKKSLTDHGISVVAGQDCALYRAVTEGHVCDNAGPKATVVVDNAPATADEFAVVADFSTAAGTADEADVVYPEDPGLMRMWNAGIGSDEETAPEPAAPVPTQAVVRLPEGPTLTAMWSDGMQLAAASPAIVPATVPAMVPGIKPAVPVLASAETPPTGLLASAAPAPDRDEVAELPPRALPHS